MKYYLFFFFSIFSQLLSAQCLLVTTFKTDNYGGPSSGVSMGNKIFFSAYDSLNGRELWCTDGTTSGTYMVKDINPGITSSIGDYFNLTACIHDSILYFKADDGVYGSELWRSDGTPGGTYLLKDLLAGSGSNGFGYFAPVDSILFFSGGGGTQLWRTDGTDTGTYVVESFTIISSLIGFNGRLYFAGDQNNSGQELWKSNGTAAGTNMLKDLNGAFGASLPINFHVTPSLLYFMANTNDGWELWKTTGTNAGTQMVKDINPTGNGILDAYSEALMAHIGDTLYFRAQDGINGYQLWRSDGTDSGTVMCSNLATGVYSSCTFPVVDDKVLVNNYLDPHFWEYDPVTDSIYASFYPSAFYINYPGKFIFNGNKMFYAGKDSVYGSEVWKADGATLVNARLQETHLTDNWYPPPSQNFNVIFGSVGNLVLFSNSRTASGFEIPLYSYDVTLPDSCFPPGVFTAVPTSDTSAHFVWNRLNEQATYDFRYRPAGSGTWINASASKSYIFLNNLDSAADYEYQARSVCNGAPSAWSDVMQHHTAFISGYDFVNLLAERSENDSTERIYWMRSSLITSIQIRYKVSGSATWTTVSSINGYKRLTGLQPQTLYEYQVRPNYNGVFGLWTFGSYYFYVSAPGTTHIIEDPAKDRLHVFPVPASDILFIENENSEVTTAKFFDITGKHAGTFEVENNQIDIKRLTPGVYLLELHSRNAKAVRKIIKF